MNWSLQDLHDLFIHVGYIIGCLPDICFVIASAYDLLNAWYSCEECWVISDVLRSRSKQGFQLGYIL